VLAFGMVAGALARFGLIGIGVSVGLAALLPASIMLLAIHGRLRDALDPIQVVQLAARTGWSYLALVLVLVVTAQGPQQAFALLPAGTLKSLAQHRPDVLVAMGIVSTAYFNMVMGAMMGYLLFQHHQDLGIAPDAAHVPAPGDARALALARAVILMREARYADALRHMAGTVADYPHDMQVRDYYHKLLCEAGADPARVTQETERYLQALLDMRRKGRLIGAFEAARRVVPAFRPNSIAVRTALAEEYFQLRQCKPAVALIGMLHKEAPASPELPAAYFLLARIYSEGARDDAKAVMILDFLMQHYPDHALAGEIKHYRQVLLALRQPGQAAACAAI
jgi:predicted Zn-dependent protease